VDLQVTSEELRRSGAGRKRGWTSKTGRLLNGSPQSHGRTVRTEGEKSTYGAVGGEMKKRSAADSCSIV